MKQAVTRELYTYWNRLRAGRSAPDRSQIDPAAIRGILSDVFILDIEYGESEPSASIRLSGTRFNALFLRELKGSSWLDLWGGEDQAASRRIFSHVLDGCAPALAGVQAAPEGERPLDLELLLLPLKHNGRTHQRIIGTIAPTAIPSWLGLLPADHLSLVSLRLIDRATEVFGAARDHSPARPIGFARPPAPRQYGYLVVHQGGR